jgi:hypothetical protein
MLERIRPRRKDIQMVYIVKDALEGARENRPLLFTEGEFLELLHLRGVRPDGQALAQRFFGQKLTDVNPVSIIAFKKVTRLVLDLGKRYKEGDVTHQEEKLARMLVTAAVAQYYREGNICSIAARLLLNAPDDIVETGLKNEITEVLAENANRKRLRTE